MIAPAAFLSEKVDVFDQSSLEIVTISGYSVSFPRTCVKMDNLTMTLIGHIEMFARCMPNH